MDAAAQLAQVADGCADLAAGCLGQPAQVPAAISTPGDWTLPY
ncbi:MAG: hypothetical protein ACRDOK_17235 [Streptosporangiaceae bacterium]